MRNVRKSSTFRTEPLRGSLSLGQEDFDVGRARGFCCILVTGIQRRVAPAILGERRFCRNAMRLNRTRTRKKSQQGSQACSLTHMLCANYVRVIRNAAACPWAFL